MSPSCGRRQLTSKRITGCTDRGEVIVGGWESLLPVVSATHLGSSQERPSVTLPFPLGDQAAPSPLRAFRHGKSSRRAWKRRSGRSCSAPRAKTTRTPWTSSLRAAKSTGRR